VPQFFPILNIRTHVKCVGKPLADTFGLSQPSVSRAISDVPTALVKRAGNYITFPKEPKLSEIKGNFSLK
jgi:hypothetical protein